MSKNMCASTQLLTMLAAYFQQLLIYRKLLALFSSFVSIIHEYAMNTNISMKRQIENIQTTVKF